MSLPRWLQSGLEQAGLRRSSRALTVGDAMGRDVVKVGPDDSVRSAANRMADAELAGAIVGSEAPGILTTHDVLEFVRAGNDADTERVIDHATSEAKTTSSRSSLEDAAREMVDGDFRHLVVVDGGRSVGLLSMRDIVRCWVEARRTPAVSHPIRKAMNVDFLMLEPGITIQAAARAMAERGAAAAVLEPADDRPYPGIFTEREVLHSLQEGADPGRELLADHLASELTFSAPGWSLKQAAEAMTEGGFQHIVVVDRHEIRGVISMRDVVREWIDGS